MTTVADLSETQWGPLFAARESYDDGAASVYDEVLQEVVNRIRDEGSIGKLDIGGLVLWKRLRADTQWTRRLHAIPDSAVRAITQGAVQSVNDPETPVPEAARLGRLALGDLPGFTTGDAIASALLYAAAPHRMAVYDKRAHNGIRRLGLVLSDKPGRYGRYMQIVEDVRMNAAQRDHEWSARDVDLALYTYGQQPKTIPAG